MKPPAKPQYTIYRLGRRYIFDTLDDAKAYAERIYARTGVIAGINKENRP